MASDPPAKRPRKTVRLGKYEVVSHIATGGMGAVYKAVDTLLKREVALKVLPPEMAAKPAALERFRREARHAAKLRHENIVTLYEFGQAGATFFLAMEFVDGVDLGEHIERKGRLDPEEARLVCVQAARALDHAHKQGIVHRDIKPSNFLVTRKGDRLLIKMSDFGLAREASDEEARVTKSGHTVGTVDYMSPEQARDSRGTDIRSDIYSLGCTLFHMLAGHAPFHEGSIPERLFKHATADPPDLRQINPRVSEALCAVVRRMLAKSPDERYPTPAALLKDLVRLESATATLSGRELLEGLAFASDEAPAHESEDEDDVGGEEEETAAVEEPAAPAARVPRPAAPPPKFRRRGEPAPAEPLKAGAVTPPGPRGPMVWVLGAAALALVPAVIGAVLLLRSPHATPTPVAGLTTQPDVQPPGGDTGRGSDGGGRPTDTSKGGPGPGKVEWPVLNASSAAPARDKWAPQFLGPWARDAEPGPGVPVLHVARLPAATGGYATLEAACAAAAAGRLTVIEIDDNGPIFQPPVAVADRSLVVRAGKGFRPLLVWETAAQKDGKKSEPESALLSLARGSLTLERLDVVGKWADPAAAGRPVLARVTDGDFQARDCTFSFAGRHAAGLGGVRFARSDAGGPPRAGAARCRLTRCVLRGPDLVALDLDSPGADVLLDGCLVVGTDQPLVQVTGRNLAPNVLRLLRSTLVGGQTAVQVSPATPGDTLPELHVRARDALLARPGPQSGGRMVTLTGAARASKMEWHPANCLYAGWKTLLATNDTTADDLRAWQVGWNHAEGEAAVAAAWPAVGRLDPAEAPADDYRPAPAPASPVGYAATSGAGPLGCDPAALPPTRAAWLPFTYDPPPAPDLEALGDGAAPPVPTAADGRYHGGRIDLTTTEDLGAFLSEMERTKGFGPRVVLHLAGAGAHKTRAIRVKGSALVLYFERGDDGAGPVLVPNDTVPPEGDALIDVDGGNLDVIGGAVRFPDYKLALVPPYALKVRGGDLRLLRCRLTGPLLHAPETYRGLVRFEGASAEGGAAKARGCALDESVLVTDGADLLVAGGGARLRLRQCVLVSGADALHFEPGATAKPRLDVQCFVESSTVAARRGAVRLGDAPQLHGPVEPMVLAARRSAFLNPFADAAPALLTAEGGALARGLLVWQGEGNVFDKRLAHEAAAKSGVTWGRLWGRGWERGQTFDVPLTSRLDLAKPDLSKLAVPPSVVKPKPGEDRRPPPGADLELLGLKKPAKPPR